MFVEPWLCRADRAMWASLALSSRASYSSKIMEFYKFRESMQLGEVWPIPVEHIMQFLLYLKDKCMAVKSMSVFLAALSFQSKCLGYPDGTADFRVQRMVEGFRRELPAILDIQWPVTFLILSGLVSECESICSLHFEFSLFNVVCLVFFFDAFRPSKILTRSKCYQKHALQWGDFNLQASSLSLLLWKSKTDQTEIGHWVHLQQAWNAAFVRYWLWRGIARWPPLDRVHYLDMQTPSHLHYKNFRLY